jgi:hypothetical protein
MECHAHPALEDGQCRTVAARSTTLTVPLAAVCWDPLDPELPAPPDEVSDRLTAGLAGAALRASAHDIPNLAVERSGRGPATIERLVNTSGVELGSYLLRPWDHDVRTPRGGRGVEAEPDAAVLEPRFPLGGRLVRLSSCRPVWISRVGGHRVASAPQRASFHASPSGSRPRRPHTALADLLAHRLADRWDARRDTRNRAIDRRPPLAICWHAVCATRILLAPPAATTGDQRQRDARTRARSTAALHGYPQARRRQFRAAAGDASVAQCRSVTSAPT